MPKPVRRRRTETLEQFDHHQDQMRFELDRASEARKRAAAHFQVLRGLSQLDPELAQRFQEMLNEGDEPVGRFDPNHRFATATADSEVLPVDRRPLGMEAIARVLADQAGAFFSVAEIHRMLTERGWAEGGDMALRVTRNTLNRAVEANKVMRRDVDGYHVQYALIPDAWHLDPGMREVLANAPTVHNVHAEGAAVQ